MNIALALALNQQNPIVLIDPIYHVMLLIFIVKILRHVLRRIKYVMEYYIALKERMSHLKPATLYLMKGLLIVQELYVQK